MKKTLSLVLALVMILGSFSTVFAATPVTTEAEAGAFLKAAGVLVGDEKGDLNLKDNLLRQDAVILVAQLRGEIKAAQEHKGLPTYEDVKIKFYNAPLAWAQENGLFVGHSDKVFGFGENLTAQEYAKVLLSALGYKVAPNGDSDIKWADALAKAEEFGILANLKVENSTEITRGEMALMTFNALGVNMKGSKETLADKLGIKMPAAEVLEAKVNDTENLKEVKVELSNAKLANAEKIANKDNYRVDNVKVERVTVDGNDVILELEKALIKNRSYDLSVRNIDKAINKTYSFKANDNASPRVEKVEVLGEYGIKVIVSEPVKLPLERNFLVDGKNIAMNLETYGREIILTPYHKTAFAANAEKLTIKELEDFAGYKASLEDFTIEIVKDEVELEVVDVVAKGNVVEVTFDKDVYADSVGAYENRKDEGNVSYRSGRQTIFATDAKKVDTNKVEYVFEDTLPRGTEVTIEGVQNHSKVTMKTVTEVVREVKDDLEPEIVDSSVSKTVVDGEGNSSAKVTLEFDKKVVLKTGDFALYTEEVVRRKELTKDKDYTITYDYKKDAKGDDIENIIVVELGKLTQNNKDKDFDYILEVSNFEDTNRNRMFRDYVEFDLVKGKTLAVENVTIVEDKKDDKTIVTVDFNYAVDRVRAEDETNYLFRKSATGKASDVKDLDGEIIVSRNGKTVTIELPEFDYAAYAKEGQFEILEGVRDKDGNKLAEKVVYSIATGLTNAEEKEINTQLKTLVEKAKDPKYVGDVDIASALQLAATAETPKQKTDAIKALTDAIKAFDNANLIAGAARELNEAIVEAKKLTGNTAEELELKLLVIKAEKLQANNKATVEEMNSMVAELKTATEAAKKVVAEAEKAEIIAARADLTTAIATATDSKVEVSADGSDVESAKKWTLQADLDTFVTAIEDAQAVVDKADATKTELVDAKTVLENAVSAYEAKQQNGTM